MTNGRETKKETYACTMANRDTTHVGSKSNYKYIIIHMR